MTAAEQVEKLFREEHGRILAALVRQFEDFELAEDALQDALVNALERWEVAQVIYQKRSPAGQGEVSNPSQYEEVSMSPKKDTQKSARSTAATNKKSKGWTDDEIAAMKEHAKELKAEARAEKNKAEGENAVLAAIAEMSESDRAMAKRLHAIIKAGAPALSPKTWYGMPAYAKDGKVVCFFQSAQKFNTRYATFGFNDTAHLDEGAMWPVAFALKELTAAEEARIITLVKKAVR
jgi:uncharacterized protein YdhG (YjbR/CyaY superfamily)